MSRPLLLLLSVAISAFMMGTGTLLFLDKRYVRNDMPQNISDSSSGSIRFDNGTEICWGPLQVTHLPNPQNANIRNVVCTYPKPFKDKPTVTLGIHPVFPGGAGVSWTVYNPMSSTPTGYSAQMFGFSTPPISESDFGIKEVDVEYIAIGKWK